jgi:hypothetical protein
MVEGCEKEPEVALQNLHPRFKSGRRLQFFVNETRDRTASPAAVATT